MGKSSNSYLLVETAAGYCLAQLKNWDPINSETLCNDLREPSKFENIVSAKAFCPFKNAEEALVNIKAIADGQPTEELINFLTTSLPTSKKSYTLGVVDIVLSRNLAKTFTNHEIIHGKDVFEILRICRLHIHKLVKSLDEKHLQQFQLGLGHSYSRSRISSDPARQDKHCQQAMSTIDLCEKTTNKFMMRVKEWYSWHYPELVKIITDYEKYLQVIMIIGIKENFDFEENKDILLALLGNSEELVNQIGQTLKSSIGQTICDKDWENIKKAAEKALGWFRMRNNISDYLKKKMEVVAPNLKNLVGSNLGSKLISCAGSLTNLAKLPASTVQLLGAEKALFRAIKTRGPTPKHGIIFTSPHVSRVTTSNKGRVSRFLANKIALASRLDAFNESSGVYGKIFIEQVEEKLNYLEEGKIPRKNIDLMQEAKKRKFEIDGDRIIGEDKIQIEDEVESKSKRKQSKKEKKSKIAKTVENENHPESFSTQVSSKKESIEVESTIIDESEMAEKKHKKKKDKENSKDKHKHKDKKFKEVKKKNKKSKKE